MLNCTNENHKNCSGLRGNCSGLRGNCSGLRGEISACLWLWKFPIVKIEGEINTICVGCMHFTKKPTYEEVKAYCTKEEYKKLIAIWKALEKISVIN